MSKNLTYTLNELLTIKNGSDYKHLHNGNIPMYGSGGYMKSVNSFLHDGTSILLPRKGTLDNIMLVKGKFWTVDTMYWTIINNKLVNAVFLFYYLNSIKIDNLYTGSTLPSMTSNAYYGITVNIPQVCEQEKIAHVLSTIDEKIETNNKINKELEAMAKTLYDYWFVQFDFPNENGKPYKSSGGKMVYNEELKREIPLGWEVCEIESYCDIFTGKKDVNQANKDKGLYHFFSCSPEPYYSNEYISDSEAILIAGNGSYTGRTSMYKGKFDLYQRTYACTVKSSSDCFPYIYLTMKNLFEPLKMGGTHGSSIPYIVRDDIAKYQFVLEKNIVEKYCLKTRPIINKLHTIYQENLELTKLRDWLLPMLMNGQVKVK